MFAKKSLFTLFIFTLFYSSVFAYSKKVSTLQLKVNFDRTILENNYNQKAEINFYFDEIKGVYAAVSNDNKDEYKIWMNSDGYFSSVNGENVIETSDADMLDLRNDIFNWFQEDLGLTSNGYKKSTFSREDSYVITKWEPDTVTEATTEIKTIRIFTDSRNQIKKAQMYDWEDTLIATTQITQRIYVAGEYYPSTMKTILYSEGKPVSVQVMTFSDIKINQKLPQDFYPSKISMVKRSENNDLPAESTGTEQIRASYSTSIPKIAVNASYSFYKKYITEQDISGCSYWPSCSSYMKTAVNRYGIAGIIVGLERLHRCTSTEKKRHLYPLSPHGFQLDYVK